jgi:glycosyltransferase involved in cell wall biosynthesis
MVEPARTARLHVLYSFPYPLDRPGVAHTAVNQIRGLASLGVRVTVFCASRGRARLPASVEVHETLVVAGRRVPHRALGVQRACTLHDRIVARRIARHPDRPALVHAWPRGCLHTLRACTDAGVVGLRESPNPHTASVQGESLRAAEHAGVPLPPTHSHAPDPSVLRRERLEYEAASRILVPSEYAQAAFVAEGVSEAMLLRHRYGCDLDRFPPREAVRPADRPFTAAFVGRGDPTKGLHVALAAWHRAEVDGVLLVAGSIEPRYDASLASQLRSPSVERLGFVGDVGALMRRADVLLLPTWTEGSALVTYEAQASGCVPLVSSASGALGEAGVDFLEHPVGDVEALAAHIRDLAGHPARLATLSARGTAQRGALSWTSAAQALVACYEDALTSRVA